MPAQPTRSGGYYVLLCLLPTWTRPHGGHVHYTHAAVEAYHMTVCGLNLCSFICDIQLL